MPTTPNGLLYPDSSAHTRLWDHLHDAASSVDARYGLAVANVAALATVTSPYPGMRVWCTAEKTLAEYDGATWDTAWTAVTFTNSWVDFGAPYQVTQYRRRSGNRTRIRGSMKNGVSGSSAFTLPAGFRPPANLVFAAAAGGAFGQVTIGSDGTVVPIGATSSFHLAFEFEHA